MKYLDKKGSPISANATITFREERCWRLLSTKLKDRRKTRFVVHIRNRMERFAMSQFPQKRFSWLVATQEMRWTKCQKRWAETGSQWNVSSVLCATNKSEISLKRQSKCSVRVVTECSVKLVWSLGWDRLTTTVEIVSVTTSTNLSRMLKKRGGLIWEGLW